MTEMKKAPNVHHHGNLRAALVRAGIAILEEEGLAGLSLRKCAARAGVSHAAPAHHFRGVEGLRAAIARAGFDRFRDRMLAEAAGAATPRARLRAICRGYLAFARENPALYDLIFSFRAAAEPPPDLTEGRQPAYGVLAECCAPFVPPGTDPRVIETQVWALCHGYALFVLSGLFPPGEAPDEAVLALVDRVGRDPGLEPAPVSGHAGRDLREDPRP